MPFNIEINEYNSLKNTLQYIHHLFKMKTAPDETYLACIKKWANQLELDYAEVEKESNLVIGSKADAAALIFDLVYLIYLDEVVEDVELEVSMEIAKNLNLKQDIVGDLLKAIATASADGIDELEVKEEIRQLIESGYPA